MSTYSDDEAEIPLRDQRYFGTGLKRRRIEFVPAKAKVENSTTVPGRPSMSSAEKYLSIVFDKVPSENSNDGAQKGDEAPLSEPSGCLPAGPDSIAHVQSVAGTSNQNVEVCEDCKLPIWQKDRTMHYLSFAHQYRLPLTHPPSSIDRKSKGLAILQKQGWDPDSRLGLGAQGQGVLFPIKAGPYRGKRLGNPGLGVKVEVPETDPPEVKPVKLDAAKVRALDKKMRHKAERLSHEFYGSDDVEKYLGKLDGD